MLSRANEGPKAGDLRSLVDVLAIDDAHGDDYGEPGSKTVLASVYARVADLAGYEIIRSQAIADKATHIVTLRYSALITSDMQVLSEGRLFYIQAVIDRTKPVPKVWLDLLCYEIEAK